ncbi:PEP-CTERM/exosortase system-associated acyltransferase [Alteromonas portus]|uniref:PEP-CTERM/exosortase system-associated acyltransferase n=1 Tax=Alteromonas portus TaxID=2565549 RepID=UPI001F0E43AB|nr:PEP-CTERM/exosortase system-associated acyltransferase [Alteromonas portus]
MKTHTISAVRALNCAVSNKLSKLPRQWLNVFPRRLSLEESISNFFFSRYELVIANEENEKQVSYKTRHKVYCEEMKFEQKNAASIEKDKYDDRAINCYIKHRPTGECAGTIRLVLPTEAGLSLPLEEKCAEAFEDGALLPSSCDPTSVCEISRLAIPREFRVRQMRSKILPTEKLEKIKQRKSTPFNVEHFPYLSIALYLMATSICQHLNVQHAYVLMEPKLARRMKAFGINFNSVGDAIEFNGKRVPYRVSPNVLATELAKPLQGFHKKIHNKLYSALQFIENKPTHTTRSMQKPLRVAQAA